MQFRLKNFLRILVPFGLTQILGVYAAFRFLPLFNLTEPVSFRALSVYDFLVLIVFVVLFFFVAIRFKKVGSIFFKVFLTLLIFSGSQSILGIWFGSIVSALLAVLVIALFWKIQNVITQNFAMILTIGGIGAMLGLSFQPLTVVYVLIIFSIYDIIAVYKTGHMIKLARSMIESRAIFGFVVPESDRGVGEKITSVAPGQGFMILGSGDVIFPLLLAASLVRTSVAQSVLVAIFAMAGLLLMYLMFVKQKTRQPMAALPPIALMSIVGYLLAFALGF